LGREIPAASLRSGDNSARNTRSESSSEWV
jgi:hypothetical protein